MRPTKSLLPIAIATSVLWYFAGADERRQRKLCHQADMLLAFVMQDPGIYILAPDYIRMLDKSRQKLQTIREQLPVDYAPRIDEALGSGLLASA